MPKKDGKIEIEWNPKELIEIQSVDGFSNPKESLQANIDKHALLRTDEVNVGIIVRIPRNKLSEIIIIGGYQINILYGFTTEIRQIYIVQHCFYSDQEEVIGCGSPRVNADLTSLPRSSLIQDIQIRKAHFFLKTNTLVYDFKARSSTRRISDETFSLKGSSTVIKIQGDIEGPIYDDRDWHRGSVELLGPNTTVFVDVTSLKGESTLHAGGITDDSEIDIFATYKNFTMIVPNCDKVEFDDRFNAFETGSGEAKCVEEPGPEVSVKFLDFDGLTSSKKNQFHPPPRILWEIIVPAIFVMAITLIVYTISKYQRLKEIRDIDPDGEKQNEIIEIGCVEPQ